MQALTDLQEQTNTATQAPETKPYSTRSWQELSHLSLPPQVFFWGRSFVLGAVAVIFGQGGLGKSRMALNLARNQVLSIPFAGLETGDKPLRHLMMGSENSIHRLQHDVRKMSAGLTPDQLLLLDTHIRMATLESPDDPFITVGSPENVARWKATLHAFIPQVLWIDPWGDVLDGEANNDEDTRSTIRSLIRLLREAHKDAACVILAHSRTGAKNIAQAIGYDAANFGKGSKALYSAARSVWNLAPGDDAADPPVVCFHAKNNNGPRHTPMAVRLNPETMLYDEVPDFDFDAWQDGVNAAAKGKRVVTQAKTPLETYRPIVKDIVVATGPMPAGVLETRIAERTKAAIRVVKAIMADVIHEGILAKTTRLREEDGRVLYGTPEQIDAIMRPKLNIDAVSSVGSLGSQTDRTNRTDRHGEAVGTHTTPLRGCVPTEPTECRRARRKK